MHLDALWRRIPLGLYANPRAWVSAGSTASWNSKLRIPKRSGNIKFSSSRWSCQEFEKCSDEEETRTTPQDDPFTSDGQAVEARTNNDANIIHEVTRDIKLRHEDAIRSLSVAIDNDKSFPTQMPWMHYVELLPTPSDKKAAALALLELLRPHVTLTKSMFKRTLPQQKPERARLRRRLRRLRVHKAHIEEYEEQIKADGETPGTIPESKDARPRVPFTEHVEKSLANDEIRKGWVTRVAPALPPDEQARLFRETTAKLLAKAGVQNHRGSTTALQRRSILALVRDIEKSHQRLQLRGDASIPAGLLTRARNPFTEVSHSTVENEIQEMERWRATESSRYDDILQRLKSDTKLDAMSECVLEKQNKITSLKLLVANDHLQRLHSERTSEVLAEAETATTSQQANRRPRSRSAQQARNHRASRSVTVPYQVQHYILGDIHERFKRAFFTFGRREFPQLMQKGQWDDPEGVSIKEFEHLMAEDDDWHALYQVMKDRLESLRFIRNAYAHEFTELNMDRLGELLVDAKSVVQILGDGSLVDLVEKYEDMLATYSQKYIALCASPRRKAWRSVTSAKEDRDVALKQLVASHGKMPADIGSYRAEKLRIRRRFDESKASSRMAYRDFELGLARELKEFSLASSNRYRLGLGNTLWAASLVKTLSEEYASTNRMPETPKRVHQV